jgi:hypothetical protein
MNYSPKFKRALVASYGGDKDAIDIYIIPKEKIPPTPLELVEIPLDEEKETHLEVPSKPKEKKRKAKDIDLTHTDDETESEEEPTTSDEEAITSASECSEYSLDSEEEREYKEAKPCRKRPKLEFSKKEIEALIEKKAQELIDKRLKNAELQKEINDLEALLD